MKPLRLAEAVRRYFTHYADFKGRSRRSEFWWTFLFNTIAFIVITLFAPVLCWIWPLATLVPSLAVCVRRLHDTGKSALYLLWLLPFPVGIPLILIRLCMDSGADNRWGPCPKC